MTMVSSLMERRALTTYILKRLESADQSLQTEIGFNGTPASPEVLSTTCYCELEDVQLISGVIMSIKKKLARLALAN